MSKSRLLVIGCFTGLLAWLFAPALSGTGSFAFRDAAHYYHPLFEYIRNECLSGRLPLWNPYDNLGMPLVGESTSSVFYPGKLLFLLPLDYTLLYNLYIVSHLALAGWTSYRLARLWARSALASGLASISYAFSGNVLFQYSNVVFLIGAAWLPWALVLADRMLVQRRAAPAIALGGVLALMILGGDPQMAYNAGLATALYALLLWKADRTNKDSTAAGSKPAWFTRRTILCAISATACLLLAAAQIVPTIETSRLSRRASYDAPRSVYELVLDWGERTERDGAADAPHPNPLPAGEGTGQRTIAPRSDQSAWYAGLLGVSADGHGRQIYDFSVGPWRFFELLWPNLSGQQFPTHRRWLDALPAEGRTWVPSLYMGLLPFLLAMISWNPRATDTRVRWLSWIVLLTVLASFGIYGGAWAVREIKAIVTGSNVLGVGDEVGGLYWLMTVLLPGYVYFRYPAKLLVLAALALSMLAARGWDNVWQNPSAALRRLLVGLVGASLIGMGAAVVLQPTWIAALDRLPPDPLFGPFDAGGAMRDTFCALAQTATLSAIILVWLRRRHGVPAGRLVRGAALFITAIDLALAQSWLLPYAPADAWRTEPGLARVMPPARDGYRIYRDPAWRPAAWLHTSSADRQAEIVRWERETLSPKYHLPYRLSEVEASGTLASADYQALLEVARSHGRVGPTGTRPHDSILDLLNARFALVPEKISARDPARPSDEVEGVAIRTRNHALPRAWIVHRVDLMPALESRASSRIRRRTEEVLFPDGAPRDWEREAVIETDERNSRLLELAQGRDGDGAAGGPHPDPLPEGDGDAAESCEVVFADPSRVEISAHLATPGLVVLSDLHFPGWELAVETGGASRAAPIWQTNRVMRGAVLPAGDHRLVYRYRPRSVSYGFAISALAAASLALGVMIARRRRRVLAS